MKTKVICFLFTVIILLGSYSASHAALIGYWGFEEGTGVTAIDSSGNGLNGTINNATYTAGIRGSYALDLNGSNSFVEVGYDPLLNPDSIAISMWFKPRNNQQRYTDLLDKGHGAGTTPYYGGYVLQYYDWSPTIGVHYGNGSSFPDLNSGGNYKDNEWHHIVANLGSDGMDLYMDGILIDSAPGQGPIVDNDSSLYFGRHRVLGRYFNGLIDEISIYNRALSEAEVQELYYQEQDTDEDDDGVPDSVDECIVYEPGVIVNSVGCSIADICPCENPWKNHGAYVSCVAHTSNDFVAEGLITETDKDGIVSTAGQSNCGSKK